MHYLMASYVYSVEYPASELVMPRYENFNITIMRLKNAQEKFNL